MRVGEFVRSCATAVGVRLRFDERECSSRFPVQRNETESEGLNRKGTEEEDLLDSNPNLPDLL